MIDHVEDRADEALEAAETLISVMLTAERKKAGRANNMMLLMVEVEIEDGTIEMWRITIERTIPTQ